MESPAAFTGEGQSTLYFNRFPALSAIHDECRLSGCRFAVLDFRFVVESGLRPDVDIRE